MKKIFFLFFTVLIILTATRVFASSITDVSSVGVGARPLGMGKAFVALADDASALFLNPSGIGQIKTVDIITMTGVLAQDISYSVLGGVFPVTIGDVGFALINSSVANIPLTNWVTTGGVTRPVTYNYTDYSSRVLSASYGVSAGELFKKEKLKNLYIGASLKYFYQGFSGTSSSLEGASGSGFDLDLGFKVKANKWLNLGASFSNILPDSFGAKFIWQRNNQTETIPSTLKTGMCFNVLGKDGLRQLNSLEAVWLLDIEKEIDRSRNPVLIHTGIEVNPVEVLCLRFGLDQQSNASTTGVGVETNMTYGIGFKLPSFSFDYAYHKYGDISANSSHYFSIGYSPPVKAKGKDGEPLPSTHQVNL